MTITNSRKIPKRERTVTIRSTDDLAKKRI